MTPSHTAQGIASLGRNGDSMLMHVSPSEVGGLKQVGDSLGIKMTTNPYTGMPEAFNFGRFLTSLLPAAAGYMVGGPGGGALGLKAGGAAATIAPIAAGMATGAAIAGAQGDDMLMGTVMGGFGGYGGGNIKTSLSNLGKLSTSQAAGNITSNAVSPGVAEATVGGAGNLGMFTNPYATPVMSGVGDVSGLGVSGTYAQGAPMYTGSQGMFDVAGTQNQILGGMGQQTAMGGGGYEGDILSGYKELTGQGNMSIGDAYNKYTTPIKKGGAGGSGLQLASTFGVPAVQEALRIPPTDTNFVSEEEKRKAEENKYRDPRTGLLNLTQASPDVRFVAAGGSIQSGGVRDLYGTPDNQPTMSSGLGGFGLGRLNDLASEQAMNQAKTLGYAMGGLTALKPGGYLSGGGDGMSDSIPATIEGKQPARLADGEFVVPADVVSHIGNGSSKAGSQRLYSMLDKIRHARTGNKKQGKQINPSKYMPA